MSRSKPLQHVIARLSASPASTNELYSYFQCYGLCRYVAANSVHASTQHKIDFLSRVQDIELLMRSVPSRGKANKASIIMSRVSAPASLSTFVLHPFLTGPSENEVQSESLAVSTAGDNDDFNDFWGGVEDPVLTSIENLPSTDAREPLETSFDEPAADDNPESSEGLSTMDDEHELSLIEERRQIRRSRRDRAALARRG